MYGIHAVSCFQFPGFDSAAAALRWFHDESLRFPKLQKQFYGPLPAIGVHHPDTATTIMRSSGTAAELLLFLCLNVNQLK